jgi:hypothetical protein
MILEQSHTNHTCQK